MQRQADSKPTIIIRRLLEVLLVMKVAKRQDQEVAGILLSPPLNHGWHHKDVAMPLCCFQTLQHAQLSVHYSQPVWLCTAHVTSDMCQTKQFVINLS